MSYSDRRNLNLDAALTDAEQRYTANNPLSQQHYQIACDSLPGGNTRTTLFYPPFPLTIARGQGAQLWDVDDHNYIDFLGEYSAGLYGHSHPKITATVQDVLANGFVYGGPSAYEARLAALMSERFPSCQLMRFCNSGTEANLMAVSAAREFTGRSHLMAFKNGYHGGVLCFAPDSSVMNIPFPIVMADYNDLASTLALIEQHADDLAAILIEPLQGTSGNLPGNPDFLQGIQDAAQANGIIFILDEVMTSRLSPGGLQQKLGLKPDMTSFGKYLGGGLTFGAFGGREDIMIRFDPRRPDAYLHGGTYNNNVFTMAAGYVGLSEVFTPAAADALNESGDQLRQRLNDIATAGKAKIQVTGCGSLLGVHFTRQPIRNAHDANLSPPAARSLFHLFMLEQGYYIGRKGYLSLSLPLTAANHDGFCAAFENFIDQYGDLLQ